jgi:hypothetical protein
MDSLQSAKGNSDRKMSYELPETERCLKVYFCETRHSDAWELILPVSRNAALVVLALLNKYLHTSQLKHLFMIGTTDSCNWSACRRATFSCLCNHPTHFRDFERSKQRRCMLTLRAWVQRKVPLVYAGLNSVPASNRSTLPSTPDLVVSCHAVHHAPAPE